MAQTTQPRLTNSLYERESEQFENSIATIRHSLKARANEKSGIAERVADQMTLGFGSMVFLIANCIWFLVWMVTNLGWIPGVPAFDPFPFGLLTMIVSLEAIFLAIIVLISQNRAAKISEIREEVDLYINSATEGEVTKVIGLMLLLLEKNGIDVENDPEIIKMLHNASSAK